MNNVSMLKEPVSEIETHGIILDHYTGNSRPAYKAVSSKQLCRYPTVPNLNQFTKNTHNN